MVHHITRSNPYATPRASVWYKKLLISGKSFFWELLWVNSGIQILDDLVEDRRVRSFEDLRNKLGGITGIQELFLKRKRIQFGASTC